MWTLTEYELTQLRIINERLKNLQVTLLDEAMALDKALRERLENPQDRLEDYEIELKIYFHLKDHPNFTTDDDNILTRINEYLKGISQDAHHYPWRWCDNHNEYLGWERHPMKEYHCWWFHCLYDHNNLEVSDILSIGNISSDIKVYYQFLDVL